MLLLQCQVGYKLNEQIAEDFAFFIRMTLWSQRQFVTSSEAETSRQLPQWLVHTPLASSYIYTHIRSPLFVLAQTDQRSLNSRHRQIRHREEDIPRISRSWVTTTRINPRSASLLHKGTRQAPVVTLHRHRGTLHSRREWDMRTGHHRSTSNSLLPSGKRPAVSKDGNFHTDSILSHPWLLSMARVIRIYDLSRFFVWIYIIDFFLSFRNNVSSCSLLVLCCCCLLDAAFWGRSLKKFG